ncbi:MFS transporter [Exilibacterium tricleocarpae]|nr:MFS transporter [Exilibacterium tricleocarpae]
MADFGVAANKTTLSHGVKWSFGIGQMAEGIKNSSFSAFLLFYYNQVLGLPAESAGLAIAVSLIFDAVTDPMIGTISDRWRSPLGRRHPFMYASAVPLAVSLYFLFAPASFAINGGDAALFAWMLTFTVLTRGAMTLYHVPHLALGAELSEDYDERTTLVAIRQILSVSGYLIVYGLGFGVFFAPTPEFENGQLNSAAYPPFAMILALISCVTVLISGWGTRSRIPYLPKPPAEADKMRPYDILIEGIATLKNRSFRWLMVSYIIIITTFGLGVASQLYIFTFFWELARFQILTVMLMGPAGSVLGYMVSTRLFARLDKRNAMIVGGVFWMLLHALPVILFLIGIAPAKGTWAVAVMLSVIYLILGAAFAQVVVGVSTTMADIADEYELEVGRRQEGVLFAAVSFAGKCMGALGSLLAGFMLTLIAWPTGEAIKTSADIPAETILSLGIMSGPVAAMLAIPGFICLMGYKLNRAKVAEIQRQLRERTATPMPVPALTDE